MKTTQVFIIRFYNWAIIKPLINLASVRFRTLAKIGHYAKQYRIIAKIIWGILFGKSNLKLCRKWVTFLQTWL